MKDEEMAEEYTEEKEYELKDIIIMPDDSILLVDKNFKVGKNPYQTD